MIRIISVLFSFFTSFAMDCPEFQQRSPYTPLYAWASSEDSMQFIEDTDQIAENQFLFCAGLKGIFPNDQEFLQFFTRICRTLKKKSLKSTPQPEDLAVTLENIKVLRHIWDHCFIKAAAKAKDYKKEVKAMEVQTSKAEILNNTRIMVINSHEYLSKWLYRISEIYHEQIHWLNEVEKSCELAESPRGDISQAINESGHPYFTPEEISRVLSELSRSTQMINLRSISRKLLRVSVNASNPDRSAPPLRKSFSISHIKHEIHPKRNKTIGKSKARTLSPRKTSQPLEQ